MKINNDQISSRIEKGWQPNLYLTNLSVAYFQPDDMFIAPDVFPVVSVNQSSSYYYEFSKADLARDNVRRKPELGRVTPAPFGTKDNMYHCKTDQVLVGIDSIQQTDFERAMTPGVADPRAAKVRFIAEQLKLHLDLIWAGAFLKDGVWKNEWKGVASAPSSKQFLKFGDQKFEPVRFFAERNREIVQLGRRRPNTLTLGIDAYNDLCNHPAIVERVKYTGSTLNPATVNASALAALLGYEKVKVAMSTFNAAGVGDEDMQFVANPHCALISYATPHPAIDEQTAGYIFAWDMLGTGNPMVVDQWAGENGSHSEFIEGLMSYDMKKVSDDLAIYLSDC